MHAGVLINLVVTREPGRICWSDVCPFELRGYSISGWAWRLQLPKGHPLRGHPGINNLLEFTAMVVNIWLECIDSTVPHPCILAVGDSTSAIRWLFKSSKLNSSPGAGHAAHLFVARKLASILIDHAACIASQHIRGEQNLVADLLSLSGTSERGNPHPLAQDNPPNDVITQQFRDEFTEQVPEDFVISQLPNEVLSFVLRALQIAAWSLGVMENPGTRTPTESGVDGSVSVEQVGQEMTLFSLSYPITNKANCSPKPSCSSIGPQIGRPREKFPEIVNAQWSQALCAKPQAT